MWCGSVTPQVSTRPGKSAVRKWKVFQARDTEPTIRWPKLALPSMPVLPTRLESQIPENQPTRPTKMSLPLPSWVPTIHCRPHVRASLQAMTHTLRQNTWLSLHHNPTIRVINLNHRQNGQLKKLLIGAPLAKHHNKPILSRSHPTNTYKVRHRQRLQAADLSTRV